MKNFKDKIVVITGATSGIGKATGEMFKNLGATVVCVARRKSDIFDSVQADITDNTQVDNAVNYIIGKYGKVDILINNAGGGISGPIENTNFEDAKNLFNLNFFGGFYITQAFLPHLRQGGKIVFVSSVAAIFPIPFQAFYSATKSAVSMLGGALRMETRPLGISVSTVLPGDVKTGFTDARIKTDGEDIYAKRAKKAVSAMEHDEKNGMSPEKVAKAIVNNCKRKNPPPQKVVGLKYKFFAFLFRVLPTRTVQFILSKMY